MEMNFTLYRSGARSVNSRLFSPSANPANPSSAAKSLYEGMRFPLKALGKRVSGS
jgi:hypothetical protein